MSADAGACCLTGVSARLSGRLRHEDWRAQFGRIAKALGGAASLVMLGALPAFGQEEGAAPGGEANLKLPDLICRRLNFSAWVAIRCFFSALRSVFWG
jgi:hypothetical protein